MQDLKPPDASSNNAFFTTSAYADEARGVGMTSQEQPGIPFWHVWTDNSGITHQTRQMLQDFKMQEITSGNTPQWLSAPCSGDATVLFSVLPAGWSSPWHENPAPQWVMPISGAWAVETMDGQRVEMGVGDLSFGGDQNTMAQDGKRGHLSWVVGDEPCRLMIVQLGAAMSPPPRPEQ